LLSIFEKKFQKKKCWRPLARKRFKKEKVPDSPRLHARLGKMPQRAHLLDALGRPGTICIVILFYVLLAIVRACAERFSCARA
jgi:hypothetical protein